MNTSDERCGTAHCKNKIAFSWVGQEGKEIFACVDHQRALWKVAKALEAESQ